jgi:hypothetical protein
MTVAQDLTVFAQRLASNHNYHAHQRLHSYATILLLVAWNLANLVLAYFSSFHVAAAPCCLIGFLATSHILATGNHCNNASGAYSSARLDALNSHYLKCFHVKQEKGQLTPLGPN